MKQTYNAMLITLTLIIITLIIATIIVYLIEETYYCKLMNTVSGMNATMHWFKCVITSEPRNLLDLFMNT